MTPRRYTREWALQKLQEYLNKRRCCDAAGEMDTKFLEQICKKPETRAVSQMDPDSICTTFGLSREPEDSGFVPASLDCYDLPSELLNQMDWVREALGVSPGNETECRMRLAAIITHCLRAERAWLAQQEVKPPNQLNLTLETSISVTVNESVTPFTVCGKVDYALWYNVKELRSSLFILEAKASDTMSTTGKFQCLAYMCMIQAIRKRHGHKNTIIYGVLSDGFDGRNGHLITRGTVETLAMFAKGFIVLTSDQKAIEAARGEFKLRPWSCLRGLLEHGGLCGVFVMKVDEGLDYHGTRADGP
ncbi:hypothetical protein BJX96DRAFT_175040 [Aspergillus floccosus]